ncbi:MAG: ABC transporter permease [Devosiaceae bacterium]|nr:ABC transporter permease [Devosiaceae bacterium]
MFGTILSRLIAFAATLFVASLAIFLLLDILPGDPARFILGISATEQSIAVLREQMGLNLPLWERFFNWFFALLKGDLGISLTQDLPVTSLIFERILVSFPLAIFAMIIAIIIGVPIGIIAAQNRGKKSDSFLMLLAQIGIAIPNFWFGMLLVLLFAVTLGWFSTGGFISWDESIFGAIKSLVLPSIALALPQAAILARIMRTALVDVANADYIRTARAKGLTNSQAIWRHGVRNALLPVMTILGLQFAFLIAGTIIIENVFYLPGLGKLIFTAISERDLVLVRGALIVLVFAVITIMLIVDLLYQIIDPRLRSRNKI